MQTFEYQAPKTVGDAVSLLRDGGDDARVLAGGTDLLVQVREGRRVVRLVVDVKEIPELNILAFDPVEGLTLGAAVPCFRIYGDTGIAGLYPGLIDSVSLIGGIQIQGRASVGGNLCNASPAADAIPNLIAHEAVCHIAGPSGKRDLPIDEFCTAPGRTALAPGEMLVSLRIPPPAPRFGARYLRFIPRNEMDIAVVGAGAAVTLSADGQRFESARVSLGAVAPTPLHVTEAGAFLAGKRVHSDVIEEAADICRRAARPITDMRGSAEQRRHLVGVLVRRALAAAIDRASQGRDVS